MGDIVRRAVLRFLSKPVALDAAFALRRLAARFGREQAYLTRLPIAMARLGQWIDPSPLRAEINFHTDRIANLTRRPPARREIDRRKPRAFAPGERIRVAVYGQFSGALSFGAPFFAAIPEDIELTILDLAWRDIYADNLATSGHFYHRVDGSPESLMEAARIVNGREVDVFCNINFKTDHRLLAALDVPCITNWCGGSIPYYGEFIDFHLYPQYQRNYGLRDRTLFHLRTGVAIPNTVAYPSFWPYDPREGVDPAAPPISARGRKIFFHGSLYKLATRDYLDLLFRVMAEVPDAEFRFMGKQMWGDELSVINERARRWGVGSRVEYLGTYDNIRDDTGGIFDENWQICRRNLRETRLWLGSFPGVGASARVEAYQAGAAVVQMGFPVDWQRSDVPIYNAWELPYLRVEKGTATTPAEYETMMRRVLLDDVFAQSIVDAQFAQLPTMLDQARIWRDLRDAHDDWFSRINPA